MGTSKCYGGPSNGLVPPFVDDPQPPLAPQRPTEHPSLSGDPVLPVSYPTPVQIPNTKPQISPALPDTLMELVN